MRGTDRPHFGNQRSAEEMNRSAGKSGASRAIGSWLWLFLFFGFLPALKAQLPVSALSVRGRDGKFTVWWRSSAAPAEWRAPAPEITRAVQWHRVRPGFDTASLEISGEHVGWRVQVFLARLDPNLFLLNLESAVAEFKPAWTIDSISPHAALALNAGQFENDRPWGWIVRNGREIQPPGAGQLASALVVGFDGCVRILDAAEIAEVRKQGGIALAIQSYPAILAGDARLPEALRAAGRGVDVDHRDSRLALGLLQDGRLLAALTRFGSRGSIIARLPFGPTTPEMAAIMGALGCRRAMLLDGGLSGQMMIRDLQGRTKRWPGLRAVPLGLIAFPNK
jgi:hypothetical protein